MTTQETPGQPTLQLSEFLAEAAAFFSSWQEDFADYAEDYYNDEEAEVRQAELDRMSRLSQAAAFWSDRFPVNSPNPA